MRKKVLNLLLVLSIAMLMTACGKKENPALVGTYSRVEEDLNTAGLDKNATLELKADGTFVLENGDETISGNYKHYDYSDVIGDEWGLYVGEDLRGIVLEWKNVAITEGDYEGMIGLMIEGLEHVYVFEKM